MADFDLLIDSLIEQCKAPEVSYVDEKYSKLFKLKESPSTGEGVFAEQLLSVKDPICSLNYPSMMAIDADFLPTTCYYCLALTKSPLPYLNYGCESIGLRICNGCHFVRFCNQDCQLQAWMQFHKYECKIFKKTNPSLLPATTRAILRVVLLKDRDLMRDEEWFRITRLKAHEHILAARGRSNLTHMAEIIKGLADSSMSTGMIQKLIFIMRTNGTELSTPVHGGTGVMLDPLLAKFNHSCEPNISIYRPQCTMKTGWRTSAQFSEDEKQTLAYVVPLRDIQKGEELLNCYVVPTNSVKDRKATLKDEYFFDCNCAKCLSDTEGAAKLTHEHPGLPAQFSQWSKDVKRNMAQARTNQSSLRKVATAMDRSQRFLEYPVLYITGDFPQLAMGLVLEALKAQAYEEALGNVLRLHFLVNPERFVGRHNPTNIYTLFLMLAVFDVMLGTSPASGNNNAKKDNRQRNASTRRFSHLGLVYWRRRMRADLRDRLDGSAMKDLICLLKPEEEEEGLDITAQDQDIRWRGLRDTAEGEMRDALKLDESRSRSAMEKTGLCDQSSLAGS
jgi:hypothetical protein